MLIREIVNIRQLNEESATVEADKIFKILHYYQSLGKTKVSMKKLNTAVTNYGIPQFDYESLQDLFDNDSRFQTLIKSLDEDILEFKTEEEMRADMEMNDMSALEPEQGDDELNDIDLEDGEGDEEQGDEELDMDANIDAEKPPAELDQRQDVFSDEERDNEDEDIISRMAKRATNL